METQRPPAAPLDPRAHTHTRARAAAPRPWGTACLFSHPGVLKSSHSSPVSPSMVSAVHISQLTCASSSPRVVGVRAGGTSIQRVVSNRGDARLVCLRLHASPFSRHCEVLEAPMAQWPFLLGVA